MLSLRRPLAGCILGDSRASLLSSAGRPARLGRRLPCLGRAGYGAFGRELISAAMCLHVPLILKPIQVHDVGVVTYLDAGLAGALAIVLDEFFNCPEACFVLRVLVVLGILV